MKLQRIGLTALFAIVATLSAGDWGLIVRSQVKTSMGAALAQTTDERKAEADRLLQQGIQQFKVSQFQAALQSWQQALTIYREIKDRQGEGNALGNLGAAYSSLGDYGKAIEYSQQSLALAREIKDRQGEGRALGNLGIAYDSLGDYGKAIEYQQQWLAIAREIKDRQGEGNALGNLGVTYASLGDYGKAIEYQQQWLAIAREIKDRQGEGRALGNLGIAYRNLGDYGKAIEYQQQSLAIAREIKNRNSEGKALGILGGAYLSLGDNGKAIEYLQQSLAIAREIKDRNGERAALNNLGLAYLNLGDYGKAIEYHEQSLALAREIKDRQGEGRSLGNLGVTYSSLGDYGKAIEYSQQLLAIAREIKDRNSEGAALNNLGFTLFRQGNLTAAETTLIQAIEVYESLRGGLKDSEKVSIIDTQSGSYLTLQQVLIAENKTDTALEISERSRARAFVELLAQRLSPNSQQPLPATFLKPTIFQLKQIASTQKATLVQYSIIYDYFKVQGKQQLKESELYIWVIKPTGEVTFRKADLKPLWQQQNTSLSNLVTSTRQSIGVRGRATIEVVIAPGTNEKQRLQKLHDLLIKPIADLLPSDPNSHVIFIPQRELFLVPFVALQDEAGKYLIEKHTILTAPSIQILELTHATRDKQKGKTASEMLIVGNPTMPSLALKIGEPPQPLSSLKGAEQEAIEIGQLFKTQPLLGSMATETAIKSKISNADIIHLATHGLFDYGQFRQGLPGAVALAPDGKEDGFLTSDEIFDLKLNASLVVLSACDTGRGQLSSDGVIGLSRAFISAGTPSIIVSLWAVPDGSTADLMTEFYRQVEKNPNKAQALRQAMLIKMKERPHPRDWAAFTLIGEAQ